MGNPEHATRVSDELLSKYYHYVQAINYPTVARGQEKLRLAATPAHTKPMIDNFVRDLLQVWQDLRLPLDNKCGSVSY